MNNENRPAVLGIFLGILLVVALGALALGVVRLAHDDLTDETPVKVLVKYPNDQLETIHTVRKNVSFAAWPNRVEITKPDGTTITASMNAVVAVKKPGEKYD